jgi:hypothetical protein
LALDNISLVEDARAKWLREAVGMSNRKDEPDNGPLRVDVDQLHRISELTIAHYDRLAEAYWDGTRDHEIIYSADFYQHCYGARQVFTRIDHLCAGSSADLGNFRLQAPGIIKFS